MKKLILILVLFLCVPQVALAREESDFVEFDLPSWATQGCLETIYKIVQHEAGSTKDDEIFQFMTEQIIRDIGRLGCNNLTRWRWKIGIYPLYKVSKQVRISVLTAISRHPNKNFISCRFIGSKSDIPVWKSHGYNTIIGFEKTVKNLTVIGVDCKNV